VRTLVTLLLAAFAVYAMVVLVLLLAGHRVAARELAVLVPNLLLLFRDLLKDPTVPRGSKWLLSLTVLWLASPIDLLPEFLPVIGPIDDALVAGLALRHLVKRAGVPLVRSHWRGEPATLDLILRAVRISAKA
jgi:uncharacterized membrane protein YkvA (DUF1232 family)